LLDGRTIDGGVRLAADTLASTHSGTHRELILWDSPLDGGSAPNCDPLHPIAGQQCHN